MQLDYTNTDPLQVPLSPSVWDYTCLSVTGRNTMQSALQLTPGTLQQPGLTFQGRTRDGINSIDSGIMGVVLEGYQSQLFKPNSISWIDFNGNVTEVIGGATSNIVVTLPSTSGRLLNDSYVPPVGSQGPPGVPGSINFNGSLGGPAYTLTISPAPATPYAVGLTVWMKSVTTHTGGAATLNINSTGATPIRVGDGTLDPPHFGIKAGGIYIFTYDGNNWILLNPVYTIPYAPIFVASSTPSGAMNGVNTVFTIIHSYPFFLHVHLNGILLQLGPDYSFSTNTITLTTAPPVNIPGGGSRQSYLQASYVTYDVTYY